jgi:outer membrane protein OmpA-like peptidoglycan-associated protein
MKSLVKLALALAVIASYGMATPAHALDVQYDYPRQVEIDARTIVATHQLNGATVAWMAPRIEEVVTFDNNSSKLNEASVAKVKKVATMLKAPAYAGKHVVVTGYTDNVGKDAGNQRLSYHRALAVVKALVADGVSANLLSAQGAGSANPVATNSTPEGRALNRRVTFSVVCNK